MKDFLEKGLILQSGTFAGGIICKDGPGSQKP